MSPPLGLGNHGPDHCLGFAFHELLGHGFDFFQSENQSPGELKSQWLLQRTRVEFASPAGSYDPRMCDGVHRPSAALNLIHAEGGRSLALADAHSTCCGDAPTAMFCAGLNHGQPTWRHCHRPGSPNASTIRGLGRKANNGTQNGEWSAAS